MLICATKVHVYLAIRKRLCKVTAHLKSLMRLIMVHFVKLTRYNYPDFDFFSRSNLLCVWCMHACMHVCANVYMCVHVLVYMCR